MLYCKKKHYNTYLNNLLVSYLMLPDMGQKKGFQNLGKLTNYI